MKYLSEIVKMTIKRIQQSTMTSVFLIIGLTLSMLMISIGISFSFEYIYAGQNKSDFMPPNGELYTISGESDQQLSPDNIEKMFQGISEDTGVIFNGIMLHPDLGEINTFNSVSAEYFTQDDGWHYPLISGRYYTAKEIKDRKNVVLIGKTLKKLLKEKDNKQYIDIYGEEYEVLGVIGFKGKASLWDNRICIPVTVMPDIAYEDMVLEGGTINFIMYHENGNTKKDKKIIAKNGKTIDDKFRIKDQGKIETENMVSELAQSQDPIYTLAIMGYVVTIIYAVNIVIFWLQKRRYEIGIRKAFGYTDFDIAKLIIGEIIGISFLATVIALLLQAVLSIIIGSVSKYTLTLFLPNIILALVVVLITALITSVLPIKRALKIPPASILKEGECE